MIEYLQGYLLCHQDPSVDALMDQLLADSKKNNRSYLNRFLQ